MPKQLLALERNGPKRLEIAWDLRWRMVTVKVDSQEIGRIEGGQKAVQEGKQFVLPDGRQLTIQLKRNFLTADLEAKVDGKPLPGSSTDPEQILFNAYSTLFVIAGLGIGVGLIAWLFEIEFLRAIGMGPGSIVYGFVYLVLGFFTKQKSAVALIVAIILYGIDTIFGFFAAASTGITPNIGGLIVRAIFLIFMIRGLRAIRELQQEQAERRRLRQAEKERY